MTNLAKWLCIQQRLRSAWASAQSDQSLRCPYKESSDAQADLSLCWAHSHFVGFVMSLLICHTHKIGLHEHNISPAINIYVSDVLKTLLELYSVGKIKVHLIYIILWKGWEGFLKKQKQKQQQHKTVLLYVKYLTKERYMWNSYAVLVDGQVSHVTRKAVFDGFCPGKTQTGLLS